MIEEAGRAAVPPPTPTPLMLENLRKSTIFRQKATLSQAEMFVNQGLIHRAVPLDLTFPYSYSLAFLLENLKARITF